MGTDTRAAELLVGALLAIATTRRLHFSGAIIRRTLVAAGGVGLVGLMWLFHVADVQDRWLYPWGLLATAGCTAAMVLAGAQTGAFSTTLSAGPLVGLGRISYGVYLLHWPIFLWFTPERTHLDTAVLFALRVALTIIAAVAMFNYLEQPIRLRQRLQLSSARWAVPIAAVLILGTNAALTSGIAAPPAYLQPRGDAPVVVHAPPASMTTTPTTAVGSSTSASSGTTAPSTTTTPVVSARRVLLVGDSVAASIEDALGGAMNSQGVTYATAASPGCGVIRGFPTDEQGRVAQMTAPCNDGVPQRQNDGLASIHPDLVVAMSSWEMTNRVVDDTFYRFGTPEADQMLLRLFGETVDRLSVDGAHVAFVRMPEVVDGTAQAVGPMEISRGIHLNKLLDELASNDPGRVRILPLDRIVCPESPCPQVVNGIQLRAHDGRHFDSPESVNWVAQHLADQILAVDLS